VNIDKDGRYFIDGAIMDVADVEAVLRQAVANNPANQSVIIRADERVPFGYVVVVANLCQKTGVHNCRMATAGEED
jgi:biopolymer transport protein ExbD